MKRYPLHAVLLLWTSLLQPSPSSGRCWEEKMSVLCFLYLLYRHCSCAVNALQLRLNAWIFKVFDPWVAMGTDGKLMELHKLSYSPAHKVRVGFSTSQCDVNRMMSVNCYHGQRSSALSKPILSAYRDTPTPRSHQKVC